jgi:hypothetical protein
MKSLKLLTLVLAALFLISCGDEGTSGDDPATSPQKEKEIREYNIEQQEEQTKNRFPCDTLALKEYILENYPAGTFLVEFDKTFTYSIPRPAVLYKKHKDKQLIFAVIAKSKEGERAVEKKNLVGYESSFINLDSTKLGTAFFYLTLFECDKQEYDVDDFQRGDFDRIWEAEVPSHGGFNDMRLKTWRPENMRYIQLNFEDGIISGHRNYNYFFVNGIMEKPHLLETYVGISQKRKMAKLNEDEYPDYWEYVFVDSTDFIKIVDSVPFYWNKKRDLYTTPVNSRWTKEY